MKKYTLLKTKPSRKQFDHRRTFKKTLGVAEIPSPGTITHFPYFITDQEASGVENDCTAYAAIEIRKSNTGKDYNPDKFWLGETLLGASANGATLDMQGQAGVKFGWTDLQGNQEKASQYFWVKPSLFGGPDWFDLLRQTILAVGPLSGGLDWFADWDTSNGIIPHTQVNLLGGHDVTLTNLNCINGIDYIDLSVHWGTDAGDKGLYHLDRYMANKVFRDFGVIYWPQDKAEEIKKTGFVIALMERTIQLINQLIDKLSQGTNPAPIPIPIDQDPPPQVSKILSWAEAIREQEGWTMGSRSQRNCNPGNLKSSTLTQSFGATGIDKDNFCIFPDNDTGFKALCSFLTLAAKNELLDYHDARTIRLFTRKYAEPLDDTYAKNIANYLKVDIDTDISLLL